MGWDDDTRLACREILAGELPTKMFLRPEAREWTPWGYGTTENHEWLRACAAYCAAARTGDISLSADWLLLLINGSEQTDAVAGGPQAVRSPGLLQPMTLHHPDGYEVWSQLGRRPDGTPSRAEVLTSIYSMHWHTPALAVAVVAREVGDTEVFEAIRRLWSGWSALYSLFSFEVVTKASGPRLVLRVVSPGNRSAEPYSGRRDWWAALLRGEKPAAWTERDGIVGEDKAVVWPHRDLIAELGADDSTLPPVACDELYIHKWVEGWSMDARGLPLIVSSSRKRDLIGWATVDSVGNVSFAEKASGRPSPEPLVVLGGDRGWQPNPRARGGKPSKPSPPIESSPPTDDEIRSWTLEQLAHASHPDWGGLHASGREAQRERLAEWLVAEMHRLPHLRKGLRRP